MLEALLGVAANTDGLVTEAQLRKEGVGDLWPLGGKRELHSERDNPPSLRFGEAPSPGDKKRRKRELNAAIEKGAGCELDSVSTAFREFWEESGAAVPVPWTHLRAAAELGVRDGSAGVLWFVS